MSKRDVPKLNRDNFFAWKILMKLHLGGLGDHALSTITTEHVDPTRTLTIEDMKKQEGEITTRYFSRIKDVVNAIRGTTSTLNDDSILRFF